MVFVPVLPMCRKFRMPGNGSQQLYYVATHHCLVITYTLAAVPKRPLQELFDAQGLY